MFQESEQIKDFASAERTLTVLAVQVFESMTEEGAEIFRAYAKFCGDFLDEREEVVREDVFEAILR